MPSPTMSKAEQKGNSSIEVPVNTNLIICISGTGIPTLNGVPFEEISTEHRSMRMWQFKNPPKGTVTLGGGGGLLGYFVDGVVVGFGKGSSAHTGSNGNHQTTYSPNSPKAVIFINVSGGEGLGVNKSCVTACGGTFTTINQDIGWWWGIHTELSETTENHVLQFGTSGTPTWSFGDVGIVVGYQSPSTIDSVIPVTEVGAVL